MGNLIKGFVLKMGQFLKKVIIIAIIGGLGYTGWIVFKKFTKDTSKRATTMGTNRLMKQGLKAK